MFIFSNKKNFARLSLFSVHISLQALHDYDVKVTYFTFLEDVNDFLFVFLNFAYNTVFKNSPPEKITNI